jgi:glycosyltransferase involved in cell wall biosynthesis
MTPERRLLVVAHAFPPSGGAGVRRVLKMVQHLAREDWDITVLTPRRGEQFVYPYDLALLAQVPTDVRVLGTFTPESWVRPGNVPSNSRSSPVPHARVSVLSFRSLYRRVYKQLGALVGIPEATIMWLPFAMWAGLRVLHQSKPRVIFATAPPYSVPLVATALKKLTGIPLVLEFRDAWVAEPARMCNSNIWRRKLETRQEEWCIRAADRVVSVTEGVTRDFIERYARFVDPETFVTIPNGYDREDFRAVSAIKDVTKDRFRIVHTGGLGNERTPKYFLKALQSLFQRCPDLRSKLEVVFVGQSGRFFDGKHMEEYVQTYGLEGVVHTTGFVSRQESLRYQLTADLLLLLVGVVPAKKSQCYGLSAKVFDYALAGKPVLAVAEEGATADFVRASGIGEVVSHHDTVGIVAGVERALAGQFAYQPRQDVLAAYDYTSLMQRVEALLLEYC